MTDKTCLPTNLHNHDGYKKKWRANVILLTSIFYFSNVSYTYVSKWTIPFRWNTWATKTIKKGSRTWNIFELLKSDEASGFFIAKHWISDARQRTERVKKNRYYYKSTDRKLLPLILKTTEALYTKFSSTFFSELELCYCCLYQFQRQYLVLHSATLLLWRSLGQLDPVSAVLAILHGYNWTTWRVIVPSDHLIDEGYGFNTIAVLKSSDA